MRAALKPEAAPRPRVRSAGVATVLDVLDALDGHGTLSLSELARETGAPKSTLHRVCSMMLERGWIARDENTATLGLGPRTAWLARATPAAALTNGFHSVAGRLVSRHNETACLVVLDGLDSLFVAKVETTHLVRLVTSVGSRLPAFASASGRVLLADLPRERVDAMYAGSALVTPTGRRLRGLERASSDSHPDPPARVRREHRRDGARASLRRRWSRTARTRRRGADAVRSERSDDVRPCG